MNQDNKSDELREEYDLRKLKVRKLGSQRKSFGGTEYPVRNEICKMKDPVKDFRNQLNKERIEHFETNLKENSETAQIHNEAHRKIKQVLPNNLEIVSSKYFYFDYFQKVKNNLVFELAALSLILVIGLNTANYLGMLFMICLYFSLDIIFHLRRFRMKLEILILEEAINNQS